MFKRLKEDPLASVWILRGLILVAVLLFLALLVIPDQYKIWLILVGLVIGGVGSVGEIWFIGGWQLQRLRDMTRKLRDLK